MDTIERIGKVMWRLNPHCTTILFGSQTSGDAHEANDIDLLILILLDAESLPTPNEIKTKAPPYVIEIGTGVCFSPLVVLKAYGDHAQSKPHSH